MRRYGQVHPFVVRRDANVRSASRPVTQKLDSVLTNRVRTCHFFLMLLIFQAIFFRHLTRWT